MSDYSFLWRIYIDSEMTGNLRNLSMTLVVSGKALSGFVLGKQE